MITIHECIIFMLINMLDMRCITFSPLFALRRNCCKNFFSNDLFLALVYILTHSSVQLSACFGCANKFFSFLPRLSRECRVAKSRRKSKLVSELLAKTLKWNQIFLNQQKFHKLCKQKIAWKLIFQSKLKEVDLRAFQGFFGRVTNLNRESFDKQSELIKGMSCWKFTFIVDCLTTELHLFLRKTRTIFLLAASEVKTIPSNFRLLRLWILTKQSARSFCFISLYKFHFAVFHSSTHRTSSTVMKKQK